MSEFKTAEELGITETERCALVQVLAKLQSGEIDDSHFKMETWKQKCGTVGCIAGWCNIVSNGEAFPALTTIQNKEDASYGLDASWMSKMPSAMKNLFGVDYGWGTLIRAKASHGIAAIKQYLSGKTVDWYKLTQD